MIGVLVFVACLALIGVGLIVAGIYVLFGTGYALVAAGVAVIIAAALMSRGMTSNG